MINRKTNYRKNNTHSTNRKYNRNLYGISKKVNKLTRDKFAPDPFEKLKNYGVIGRICNKFGNKAIAPTIVDAAYSSTGNFYNPKKDSPYKGSLLYTLFYIGYSLLALGIFSMIIHFLKF